MATICNLLPPIPITHKHSLLSPAGHITNTLGNRALTHSHPLTSHTARPIKRCTVESNISIHVFPFSPFFLVPSHTHTHTHTHTHIHTNTPWYSFLKINLKKDARQLLSWPPCVVLSGGALSCCDPLRRTPEASITAETLPASQEISSMALFSSGWMSSHLFK